MKQISYNVKTLNLINELASSISAGIIVTKDNENDKIIINRSNPSQTVTFFLKTKLSDFDFEGEEISFYNFPEFYQLMSAFKEPNISQDMNKLEISKNKSKIKYVIADSETMTKSPNGYKIDQEPDCVISLEDTDLKNITKMIGLVSVDTAKLQSTKDGLQITLFKDIHENTYEKTFSVESSNDEMIDFNIPSEVFQLIPNNNYRIKIWSMGVVIFEYLDNDVSLEIMTAEVESN